MLPAVPAPAAVPPPSLDRLAALPEIRPVLDAANAKDWAALDAGFGALTDPATHLTAVSEVAKTVERGFLEEVAAAHPTSPLAATLLARRLVADGWEIRTGAWGTDVSAEQWNAFNEHLHRAEQLLIEVTARQPGYTSAWTERLHTARGLSLGQAEARRRYDKIAKVAPHLYGAQNAMIQQLCPKWSGSYESMHAFAVECTTASPPGSVNGAVVAAAHIEHWLMLLRDGGSGAAEYIRSSPVQQQLTWAAEHSVLNPAFRPAPGWVGAHCAFAMAFSLADNYPAAATHFNALLAGGNLADEAPFNYLGDPSEEFVKYRKRAFEKGSRR